MSNEEGQKNQQFQNHENKSEDNCSASEEFPLDENEYTPAHIANYILYKAKEEDIELTPMKLIKIVYIIYGWYLVYKKRRLFREKIEAWRYGPVIPSLYHEFKRFGGKPIEKDVYAVEFSVPTSETSYPIAKDKEVLTIANTVWQFYRNRSGEELSRITHDENGAWIEAWLRRGPNSELRDRLIAARSLEGIERFVSKASQN